MTGETKGERIAKAIARAGVCSRREAERLIAAGRVEVDGTILDSPAFNVGPEARIRVDGKALPAREAARLWRYHKPRGVITTTRDPDGRTTVYDRLPKTLPRVLTIGRLDLTSEGLLLLTNDGALKRRLELPSTGWIRRYRVRVHGRVVPDRLAELAAGVRVDGIDYGPIEAILERQTGANAWIALALREGKNREIRLVMAHLGLSVNRLIRISYGPFQLGRLAPDGLEEVPPKVLREQLGESGGQPAKSAAAKIGTAKAKPRPTKPGGRKPGRRKPGGRRPGEDKPGEGKPGARKTGPKAAGGGHAHRRRPS